MQPILPVCLLRLAETDIEEILLPITAKVADQITLRPIMLPAYSNLHALLDTGAILPLIIVNPAAQITLFKTIVLA